MPLVRPQTLIARLPQSIARRLAAPGLSSIWLRLLGNRARIDFWNHLGCHLHPDCFVGPLVKIVSGTDIRIGPGSALSGRIELAAWGPISIGRNVMISDEVHLLTGSHAVDDPAFTGVVAPIVVEDNVWLAQGAVVLPGVTIGEGAVVGAYAVVPSDVPARAVVVGNPAHVVRQRKQFEPTFIPAEFLLTHGHRRP